MSVIDQDTSAPLTGAQILARLNAVGLAFVDSSFSIIGSSDATKIAKFEVDGFTTGITRTFTLPNATGTVALLSLAQTWSATQIFAGINATSIGATTPGTVAATGATVNAGGSGESIITLNNSTNGWPSILMLAGATHYAWKITAQNNISEAYEITPSTVVGGLTFTTPLFLALASTRSVLINSSTDDTIHKLQVAGPATSTGQSWAYNAYSGSVSLTTANGLCVYTGSGTSHSFTLPAASAYGSAKAGRLVVKNQGTVGAMYVVPAGADTIFTGVSGVVAVGLSIGESREFETNGTGVWSMV